MKLFFGKPKAEPKDAIITLRQTMEMLDKRRSYLDAKSVESLKLAKQKVAVNKHAAMLELKRKKRFESEIVKIHNTMMTLEEQIMSLEGSNVNAETMNAMKMGAEALKKIHKSMDANKVDDIMDSIREQQDTAEEISEAISRPLGEVEDDDELLRELEELEQQELDEKMLNTPALDLPHITVPEHRISGMEAPARRVAVKEKEETDEEAELRALQASMAM